METCKGNCGNPLHTASNIQLARAIQRGDLWGDLVNEMEEEEREAAKRRAPKPKPKPSSPLAAIPQAPYKVGDVVKRTIVSYKIVNGKRVYN